MRRSRTAIMPADVSLPLHRNPSPPGTEEAITTCVDFFHRHLADPEDRD